MNFQPVRTGNNHYRTLKDLSVIAFVLVFPHFAGLPFYSYAVICFLLIWFFLKKEGKTLRDIGLLREGINTKIVLTGLVSALIWVAFMQLIYIPVNRHVFNVPDYSEYDFIRNSLGAFFMILAAAWVIGGFYEEILFRGFIQTLMERIFPRGRLFWTILITSTLFGVYHCQQGASGIIAGILGGLYWGLLNKKFSGNLWAVIFSHALFDTIELVLIYTGMFGKL